MRGPLREDRLDPWSELKADDLLSALAFGASFEKIVGFLIDNVAEREIDTWIGRSAAHGLWARRAARMSEVRLPTILGWQLFDRV
jgi:hypothetical protein